MPTNQYHHPPVHHPPRSSNPPGSRRCLQEHTHSNYAGPFYLEPALPASLILFIFNTYTFLFSHPPMPLHSGSHFLAILRQCCNSKKCCASHHHHRPLKKKGNPESFGRERKKVVHQQLSCGSWRRRRRGEVLSEIQHTVFSAWSSSLLTETTINKQGRRRKSFARLL